MVPLHAPDMLGERLAREEREEQSPNLVLVFFAKGDVLV
jgi:hypothetical protein